ncbi:hypothetical protein CDD81_7303 [Ophiocordyceps australis]|uniref:Bifunctional cytochrome P450/NADPH--P450 reductase n=1 Tax=Ophiocordyceps australis TaxID=1399860 RepID=A0A2C5Y3L4_9HYPO|nr:hypothetical protein CDD81_7303 [Ophiocordyceps australis]
MAENVPIPEPPGLPLIGNLGEFTTSMTKDLSRLADTYGAIFRLHKGSQPQVYVSSYELLNEICNEKRFHKSIGGSLLQVREGVHDGLFTAYDDEPNWEKAHRILVPAFGPLTIRAMFDDMYDISTQLALKIARYGPQTPIPVSDTFTRLALDTLALCAMDYRFNSFYSDEMHPFVGAMCDFLDECGRRGRRPAFAPNFLYRAANEKFYKDIGIMRKTAEDVIEARKANPSDRKDLLNAMLNGTDSKTGEKLSDDNVASQLITFLTAGHETTSGLLSFAFYNLLKTPSAYQAVQREVDTVIGRDKVAVEHTTKLPYITAVLRETLRVTATIFAIGVEPYEDTLLAGKYLVHKGETITALLSKAHLDPAVYGEDANDFKPERMLDENFARLNKEFPNCWKPFGNGKRACIGRPFAWQEAIISMAVLFQNFNFSLDDPNYHLETQETLTLKPKNFNIRASLRHNMTPTQLELQLTGKRPKVEQEAPDAAQQDGSSASAGSGKPLAIFYGSNSGTCEAFAQRVAANASRHGFKATTVAPLDDANQKMPKDRPVVIVTASYEGQPPSNAALFVGWIEGLKGQEMQGVSYAVFGCGHHDWPATYQRIPKLVDSTLEKLGGQRLLPIGAADAGAGDMFEDFETWEEKSLWPGLQAKYGAEDNEANAGSGISVEVSVARKKKLRQEVEEAMVVSTQRLTQKGPEKRQIEIRLPTGMTYKAGDYLAVLPLNNRDNVSRVFRRFGLSWDATLMIKSDRPTTLPTDLPVSALNVVGAYVELAQPATKRNIQALAESTENKADVSELQRLASDGYASEISEKRISVLDLLERFPSVDLPLGAYLDMLPPMRVRQYSISSSPLHDASTLTLTYSVLESPALSGHGTYVGVTTHFLSSLQPGEKLHVAVRPSEKFHLPHDAEKTPLICAAAGSGVAPFIGFMQERATMVRAGRKVAPAMLFFGCRAPDSDDIYAEQLAEWEKLGVVDVRRAYSDAPEHSYGCRFIQHRITHDADDLNALYKQGARVYLCGSRMVGQAVEEAVFNLVKERGPEKTDEETRAILASMLKDRYVSDVFG